MGDRWGREKHGAPLGSSMVGIVQGRGNGGARRVPALGVVRGGRKVARVGAKDAAVEGAEVGKMTAEPSVRHVLPSRVGLCFRSVPPPGHVRYRVIAITSVVLPPFSSRESAGVLARSDALSSTCRRYAGFFAAM